MRKPASSALSCSTTRHRRSLLGVLYEYPVLF
jgi:hypothetical protein